MTSALAKRHLLPLVALAVVAVPACNGLGPFDSVEGSGVPETTTLETAAFDEIQVTGVFDVTLSVSDGPPSVTVTVDDNLVDDLDVGVSGDRLKIGFDRGSYDLNVRPTAIVSVADLRGVEVSGASQLTAENIEGEVLNIDVSGASTFTATGAATAVTIDASGASSVDLTDFEISSATVDASGASSVALGSADRVTGDLSGASHLRAPSDASGSIETSGGSEVERE